MKKQNKIYLGIGIVAVILIASIVMFSAPNGEEENYKIGLIAPLSGFGAIFGESYLKGAELALEEVGSVNNREVKLISEDSKFEGKASVDAANFLINVENVDILDALFHLPSQSVNPIAKDKKIPFIYEAYTRSMIEDNPYAFKAHFDAVSGCEELMQYAKQNRKYEKIGILMAQTEYSQLCLEGMKKVEPNIEEYWYTFGDTDFKTLLTKMNNDGVDTLMTIMVDFEYAAMFKQLTELGYPIKVMCATASECIYPQIESDIPGEVLEGTLGIDFIPSNIRETSFGKKYLSKYPDASFVELNYAVTGYEMIKYTTKALESCKPNENECIIQSLKNVNNYGSVLGSPGFSERVLQVENKIYSYENGDWLLAE